MAQWLVRRTVERLGGGAVGSIPTVGVCQLTAIFQHWWQRRDTQYLLQGHGSRNHVGVSRRLQMQAVRLQEQRLLKGEQCWAVTVVTSGERTVSR